MTDVFHHAPIAALVLDAGGRVEAANEAASRLLCRSAESLIGCDFFETLPQTDRITVERSGDATSTAMRVGDLADGSSVVQLVERPEADCPPEAGATLEEQRAFRSALLELSEMSHGRDDDAEFYDTLLERAVGVVPGAQAGSILIHRSGTDEFHFVAAYGFDLNALQERCLYQDQMFRDVETPEAVINRDVAEMVLPPEQDEWLASAGRIREIAANVSVPVFVAGQPVAFISLYNFDDRNAFSLTSVEMTTVLGRLIADLLRRRELEAEVRRERESFKHLALHDELTGLANRRHIETSLDELGAEASSEGVPFALFFVDIDDFKGVNDDFGHEAGDEILVAVAEALRDATRPTDLVGRWGGDEFMVIARGVTQEAAVLGLAQRVLRLLDEDIVLRDGRSVPCRLSIGASWTRDGSANVDDLVRQADGALYDAKRSGKHAVRVATS